MSLHTQSTHTQSKKILIVLLFFQIKIEKSLFFMCFGHILETFLSLY